MKAIKQHLQNYVSRTKINLTDNNQDIDIDTAATDAGWLLQQFTWAKRDK